MGIDLSKKEKSATAALIKMKGSFVYQSFVRTLENSNRVDESDKVELYISFICQYLIDCKNMLDFSMSNDYINKSLKSRLDKCNSLQECFDCIETTINNGKNYNG